MAYWSVTFNGISTKHLTPSTNIENDIDDSINLQQIQIHNISTMIKLKYEHFQIILLSIVIDDRYHKHSKLKLFGAMPYQLLDTVFWTKSKYAHKYCNRLNKCILNYDLIMPLLILQSIANYPWPTMLLKNVSCIVQSLDQNHFHLMQRRRGRDYAMVSIQCDLPSNVNQTKYTIKYFELSIQFNVNKSFTGFLFPKLVNKTLLANFSSFPITFYSAHTVYYNYDALTLENIEIRWINDKHKFDNDVVAKIGICTTTTFGFPPFIALWMHHHVELALIGRIFVYVNYKLISPQYQRFLHNVKYSKIEIVNWTITNALMRYSTFYEFQQLAYLHCHYSNMYRYKWLLYLDADDSLVIFNNIAFSNFIRNIEGDKSIHSVQFPWIGWSYCCIYEILNHSVVRNENITFCQLRHGKISKWPPHYGKFIMKPTFVDIPFVHKVQSAMDPNGSTSMYLGGDINDFVYVQHMQAHKLRPRFKAYEQHMECKESLKNHDFLFQQNMELLNQSMTNFNNHTKKWLHIMFNTNIVYANHSYYC